jgi:hypothetical protein
LVIGQGFVVLHLCRVAQDMLQITFPPGRIRRACVPCVNGGPIEHGLDPPARPICRYLRAFPFGRERRANHVCVNQMARHTAERAINRSERRIPLTQGVAVLPFVFAGRDYLCPCVTEQDRGCLLLGLFGVALAALNRRVLTREEHLTHLACLLTRLVYIDRVETS